MCHSVQGNAGGHSQYAREDSQYPAWTAVQGIAGEDSVLIRSLDSCLHRHRFFLLHNQMAVTRYELYGCGLLKPDLDCTCNLCTICTHIRSVFP